MNFDARAGERFANLALDCIHREYPSKIAHVLHSDNDVRPPRELTPAFYGCFDWHSAVHGHWLLVRLLRTFPDGAFAVNARDALSKSFTQENIAAEVRYMNGEGRETFERPYGLAWLLQLAAELQEWNGPSGQAWYETLKPLEQLVADRIKQWLPKLSYPIRDGEHPQTAFAFGLIMDWARTTRATELEKWVVTRCLDLYFHDVRCPINYEPSGQDFLSPCLAEADLMRRILEPPEFASWLTKFLPDLRTDGSSEWLPVAIVSDPTDGKLAHLDGLNLSRAWMMHGIAAGLPKGDSRIVTLEQTANAHARAGLASVTGEHYQGGHWLASFAVYLLTRRGIRHEASRVIS